MNSAATVFISYAHADDTAWTGKLAADLERDGFTVFFDRWDIASGDSLVRRLDEALGIASAGLIVFGRSIADSPWVHTEYSALVQRVEAGEARLIVVLLGDVPLPPILGTQVIVDFRHCRTESEYRSCLTQLEQALRGERPPRSAAQHAAAESSQRVSPTSAAGVAADQHLPKATISRQPKIFLCHSSSDKPSVRALRRKLLDDGCQPWLDEEDILPGQDWDREIRQAIEVSDLVLVCLSRASVNKVGYLQKEIRSVLDAADEQPEGTIFVIPARLEPCEVPERLRRYQWVDLFEDTGYPRLLRAVWNRRGE